MNLKLKMSLILLLTICLEGCASFKFSELADHERCVWSLKHQICRCHTYRVSPETVGRVSESVNKPAEHCDKLVGFAPETWIEYVLWLEENFQAAVDAQNMSVPLGKRKKRRRKWIPPDLETKEELEALVHDLEFM